MFARIVLLLLTACQLASTQTALPVEAAEFLKWYRGYQGSFYPEEVLKAYRGRLGEKGVAAAEIERQVAIVTEVARSSPPEMLAIHFDKIYSASAAPFKQEPSAFLV